METSTSKAPINKLFQAGKLWIECNTCVVRYPENVGLCKAAFFNIYFIYALALNYVATELKALCSLDIITQLRLKNS